MLKKEHRRNVISRRNMFSLLGLAAFTGVAVASTVAAAQTSGMERRDDRRDERENAGTSGAAQQISRLSLNRLKPNGADPIATEAVAELNAPATTAAGKRENMPDMSAGLGLS